jgi:ketosteroid isomerase-like protein
MNKIKSLWCSLVVVLIISASSAGLNAASANDEADVTQAANQFYVALNTMFKGEIEPMLDLWSHEEDITYLGPVGDYLVGWTAIEKSWRTQAALKLGGEVLPIKMHVIVGSDIAVVTDIEDGENTGPDGKPQNVKIRATTTLRKENGVWKIIGHHTDLLPFLAK